MELRHLRALVAVSEHGSFSSAADALGTVQSNISAHVARLEKELGTPLVDRSAGRLTRSSPPGLTGSSARSMPWPPTWGRCGKRWGGRSGSA
jgi:molybdenum-dependent DNA-binding transcriptional regulator ModE